MSKDLATVPVPGIETFGLEGLDPSTLSTPRLKIDGPEGVFVHDLSGETFEELNVVLLGMFRQRNLWPPTMGKEKTGPLCRSYDAVSGHPDLKDNRFWKATVSKAGVSASGFDPAEYSGKLLPCDSCELKEWGSHPSRENAPWCGEVFVVPVMLDATDDDPGYAAILSLTGAQITPAKKYMTSFVQKKQPLFTATTRLTLNRQSRGEVDYSVIKYARTGDSPEVHFPSWMKTFVKIRDMLITPRVNDDDGVPVFVKPATTTRTGAPITPSFDEDEPF